MNLWCPKVILRQEMEKLTGKLVVVVVPQYFNAAKS